MNTRSVRDWLVERNGAKFVRSQELGSSIEHLSRGVGGVAVRAMPQESSVIEGALASPGHVVVTRVGELAYAGASQE